MELDKLGKYQIKGLIGTGSMGQVYQAQDPVLKRSVAIKTMAATTSADSQLVQRFKREAQSAARLNHPNIITVFDFGEEQGTLYMAMELLKGQDLKDLIGTSRLASLRRKLDLLEQILEGVSFAHAQGVTHRDIKPGNIHIQPNGRVKILDFGLARPQESEMTQAGMVMGTPNYMSPEQVRGQKAGPRSDVFSLGAVAYEVLSGRRAFRAESMHKILQRVLAQEPEPLLSRVPDLPPPLERWVAKAMRKNPAERFADASVMLEGLRELRGGLTPEVLDAGAPLATGDRPAYDETITTDSLATVVEDAPTRARHAEGPRTRGNTALAPAASVARRPRQAPTLSGAAPTAVGTPPSSWLPVYAGAALVVIAIAIGVAVYLMSGAPGGAGEAASGDVSPEQMGLLTEALVANQVELARLELENKDYQTAIVQAQQALEFAPESPEALSIVAQAQANMDELERLTVRARDAFQGGDSSGAAAALEQAMALDPRHPVVAELTGPLNEHFRSQAEGAQGLMERSRAAARRADATATEGYAEADVFAREGQDLMAMQEFAVATQKFLQSRDGFERAQRRARADQKAAAEQRAAAERRAEAEREIKRQADEARQRVDAERRAAAAQTPAPTRTTQPPASASPVPTATARATPVPTAAPQAAPPRPTLPPVPTLSPQEIGARGLIDTYRQAFEGQNLELFRSIKPNLSKDEEKRLNAAFKAIKSQEVGIEIQSVAIAGQNATIKVKRQDMINGRQTPEVSQTFNLVMAGGRWVIDSIGQ